MDAFSFLVRARLARRCDRRLCDSVPPPHSTRSLKYKRLKKKDSPITFVLAAVAPLSLLRLVLASISSRIMWFSIFSRFVLLVLPIYYHPINQFCCYVYTHGRDIIIISLSYCICPQKFYFFMSQLATIIHTLGCFFLFF